MRESVVEKYLKTQVAGAGGMSEKHTSPGQRGVPDQLVTWPRIARRADLDLVETKAPGKKPRPDQDRDHKRRVRKGCRVYLIDTKEKVDIYVWHRKWGAEVTHLYSIPLEA